MTRCSACPHLRDAHTVPDGRCRLCECAAGLSGTPAREPTSQGRDERHRLVVDALRSARWPGCPDEYALQAAAEERLSLAGIPVEREVALSTRDRIDLLAGRVGVECKVAGSPSTVVAQLARYAGHGPVESLVLLTRKAAHRDLPAELGGKPLTVVFAAAVL